jgi:ribosomal protein L36
MKVKASLRFRTEGREEIRVRRKGVRYILPKKTSTKAGRLKVRTRIPKRRKDRINKKCKF